MNIALPSNFVLFSSVRTIIWNDVSDSLYSAVYNDLWKSSNKLLGLNVTVSLDAAITQVIRESVRDSINDALDQKIEDYDFS